MAVEKIEPSNNQSNNVTETREELENEPDLPQPDLPQSDLPQSDLPQSDLPGNDFSTECSSCSDDGEYSSEESVAPEPVVASEPVNVVEVLTEQSSSSFLRNYALNILIAYSARCAIISINVPVYFGMIGLNSPSLQSLLAVSPILTNALATIPMNWRVNKNGGKKEALLMHGLALTGMVTLTTLFSSLNIGAINGFDWRYGLMLGAGLLIGGGAASFQLIVDALKWAPQKIYIPKFQMLYSLLVDSSLVTTPLITYFSSITGYYLSFSIYSGIVLSAGLLALFFLYPSPYHQFKTRYPHVEAKALAVKAGQLPELIKDYDNVSFMDLLRENTSVLFDRRSLLLCFSVFSSFGSFFVSRTILPSLLVSEYGFTHTQAIIMSSMATLISILTRPLASLSITRWDRVSGGIKAHILGCLLTIAGTIPLTIGHIPRWLLYSSFIFSYVGFGVNMVTPLSIAIKWSKPEESHLKEVNPSTMFGLFATIGSLGGTILPILLNLMTSKLPYFCFLIGIIFISCLAAPIIDYQVRRGRDERFFNNTFTFFNQNAHPQLTSSPSVSSSTSDIEALQNYSSDDEIYVDGFANG